MTTGFCITPDDYLSVGMALAACMISLATCVLLHRNERAWFRDQIVTIRRERRQIVGWTKEGWPIASARDTALIVDSARVAFAPIAELPSFSSGPGEA